MEHERREIPISFPPKQSVLGLYGLIVAVCMTVCMGFRLGRGQQRKRTRLLPVFRLRPIGAVVAIAVAIPITVAIPIAIPAVRVADSVDDHPEHGGSQVVEELPSSRRVMMSQRRGMDDHDDSIGHGADNRRVRHGQHRRGYR